MNRRGLRLTGCLLSLLAGCATTRPAKPTTVVEMEPLKLEVVRTPGGPKVEAYDAATLFEEAGADLAAQRWADAAGKYDRLLAAFPGTRYSVASLYNAGLALEGARDFAGAAARYRRIVSEHGQTKDALDAWFRLGGCYAELGNWAASADAFAEVVKHPELTLGDRIEALARRGLAQYQAKDGQAAERTFREAMTVYRANEIVERLESDFFVAMSQFYLGEIAHDQFRGMPLRLPQKQLAADLEAKAQMLLSTQARYVDTARVRNPGWATAAGCQMAMLYREFYDSLMAAPIPPELTEEQREIYMEELRKEIAPLLRKAIHAHELTQGVAERFGIDNEWVRKSNEQMEQLRDLLAPGSAYRDPRTRPAPSPASPPPGPERNKLQPPFQPPPLPTKDYRPRILL